MKMTTWKELETQAFITGSKLPKEVIETNKNHQYLIDVAVSLREIEEKINKLKQTIVGKAMQYESAKEYLRTKDLEKLNKELPEIKKLIDFNFDMTLNGILAKGEGESENEIIERLQKDFKLTN